MKGKMWKMGAFLETRRIVKHRISRYILNHRRLLENIAVS